MKQIPVCLFARTSSEGSMKDRQDYERQIRELNNFCKSRSWDVVKVITTKISGRRSEKQREDLKELLECAKKRMFKKVIISECSRLGRTKYVRTVVDDLHAHGISVVFFNLGGMESLDPEGKETFVMNILITILIELSIEESRNHSYRIRSALTNLKEKGVKLGRQHGEIKSADKLLKEYAKVVKDLKKGLSLNQCKALHGLSKNTIIKIKRKLHEQEEK
jgi:DNA invertase Pin-like site-specific DNA recombinase